MRARASRVGSSGSSQPPISPLLFQAATPTCDRESVDKQRHPLAKLAAGREVSCDGDGRSKRGQVALDGRLVVLAVLGPATRARGGGGGGERRSGLSKLCGRVCVWIGFDWGKRCSSPDREGEGGDDSEEGPEDLPVGDGLPQADGANGEDDGGRGEQEEAVGERGVVDAPHKAPEVDREARAAPEEHPEAPLGLLALVR